MHVQKTIKAGAEILPYEKVCEMIDQARVVGISKFYATAARAVAAS